MSNKEQEDLTTIQTREAVNKIIQAKLHGAKPTTINTGGGVGGDNSTSTDYIRYTPASITDGDANKKQQRIIKIVDKQQDPMLPSSFKIKKTPRGPPEQASVPVLHEQSKVSPLVLIKG
ncbi:unnamed protein product [Ambrosiozyma monospora]|uniref:Unnamed protein product n=1 Tax=Ambrosiozyma monospora TaxID=43982 RepID=A0ACB5T4T4_AMBMO|nr:unnamed protein product [Ambrosiozyma monospora]